MVPSKSYLVPLDFSRGSEKALDYALALAREQKTKIVALHVVPAELIYPPTGGRFDFYTLLERDARENFRKLAKRKKLKPEDCRFVVARGTNFADIIARQAKKMRVAMIVMGSHGRTGLQRFFLGSVAEKTLRYADCPVLIVKK
ncbi:MAG TPA: universal stress protein [Candidatus Binatia bacterium]|nr:universal stress protein [Candidatus Binatia bacterium]